MTRGLSILAVRGVPAAGESLPTHAQPNAQPEQLNGCETVLTDARRGASINL